MRAPFSTLDLSGQAARDIYGYDLILVRPDLHVVWRGNKPPENPADDVGAGSATGPPGTEHPPDEVPDILQP